MKKDDHSLSAKQHEYVRRHAHLLLSKASAYNRFPTPVDDLIAAAELEVERDITLDATFLGRLYKQIREPIRWAEYQVKKAVDKVQGLLWREERRILLDSGLYPARRTFISLHEVGHDFLPDQRATFAIVEDSESELDPETKDLFERQASVFASKVLFQLGTFDRDAADCNFGLRTPIDLSKRCGASVYASARRYVQNQINPCALIVFNAPVEEVGVGTTVELRRAFQSPSFTQRFGQIQWPEKCGPGSFFVEKLPRNTFSKPFTCQLTNIASQSEECLAEVFMAKRYQVLFLIYPADIVSRSLAV